MLEKDKSNKHIESLAVLIDLIPDPVLIADSSGQIIAANNMIEKVADYKKEELIGKTISSLGFVTEEYKQLLAKNAKDRLAGANIPPYEIKITNKNGEVKCLKVNGNRFVSNGEALNFATFHDVTAENKLQDELWQGLLASEEKFHGITNVVKEAIITVDQNAVVTYWNPAAENIFGYTNKEAVGKSVHELVVPISMCREGIDRIKTSVKTFGETGMGYFTVGNVELIGRRKNGCEFPAELSISPVKLCGKLSAVGVVTDITRRKQSEQRLRDAEQRYHALFNQVPLGVLVVDPETAGFVEFNDIAHTQLGYSREVHLEQQGESLKKLLAESLCLLELPEKIEVQDQLSDEPTVNVDADKIKRIFINLIKNAVDAMPNGGKITVASQQVNGRLEVSFSDTGRGISDEVLPKLFSPLFTTKAQGMGFGLAICKRIIEAHGGTITVKTVKEKGTTFTLTFPVEPKISSWR